MGRIGDGEGRTKNNTTQFHPQIFRYDAVSIGTTGSTLRKGSLYRCQCVENKSVCFLRVDRRFGPMEDLSQKARAHSCSAIG